jgi:hypothetical protein
MTDLREANENGPMPPRLPAWKQALSVLAGASAFATMLSFEVEGDIGIEIMSIICLLSMLAGLAIRRFIEQKYRESFRRPTHEVAYERHMAPIDGLVLLALLLSLNTSCVTAHWIQPALLLGAVLLRCRKPPQPS